MSNIIQTEVSEPNAPEIDLVAASSSSLSLAWPETKGAGVATTAYQLRYRMLGGADGPHPAGTDLEPAAFEPVRTGGADVEGLTHEPRADLADLSPNCKYAVEAITIWAITMLCI